MRTARTVLLVEDNPGDAELIRALLAETGIAWGLHACVRLQEALAMLEREAVDAVLLDLGLPDSNGIETLQRLQAAAPHLPLIVLTGLNSESLAADAIASGAQDYLVKGEFDGPLLVRSVTYAIERKQSARRLAVAKELSDALNRINSAVHSTYDWESILGDVVREAMAAIGADAGFVGTSAGDSMCVSHAVGAVAVISGNCLPRSALPAVRHAEERRDAVAFNHAPHHPHVNHHLWGQFGVLALAVAPMLMRGECMGAIVLFSTTRADAFTDEHVDFLRKLAAALGLAVDNAAAYSALRRANAVLDAVSRSTPVLIVVRDREGRFVSVNPAALRVYRLPEDVVVGRTVEELFGAEIGRRSRAGDLRIMEQGEGGIGEDTFETDGQVRHFLVSKSPWRNAAGETIGVIVVASDITERKQMEEEIRHMAHHDALTGLPNRRMFAEIAQIQLAQARRYGSSFALLFLDLDRFKHINDTLGHETGDRLLMEVAARLRATLRRSDTIARIGGDEFNVLLPEVPRGEQVTEVARSLVECFDRPFEVDGHTLFISSSIGVSLYPVDGDDLDSLLRHADVAMYHAKELGRNRFQFFNQAINLRSLERLRIENQLRQSLERGELLLVYQPQIDLRTGRVVGAEALVRWRHPELGLLAPDRFIPMAEEIGFIGEIDGWVADAAGLQLRQWSEAGLGTVPVTINLSARQFQRSDLAERLGSVLSSNSLAPGLIHVEVTETVAMSDIAHAVERMEALTAMGVCIAIDDFGTGYSSLSYLKRMPVAKLKIDRSFVQDITFDLHDRAIVTAVTAMAHSMQLRVIAEGVESDEQLALLRDAECDEAQGFLFNRPLPAAEFGALIGAGAMGRASP